MLFVLRFQSVVFFMRDFYIRRSSYYVCGALKLNGCLCHYVFILVSFEDCYPHQLNSNLLQQEIACFDYKTEKGNFLFAPYPRVFTSQGWELLKLKKETLFLPPALRPPRRGGNFLYVCLQSKFLRQTFCFFHPSFEQLIIGWTKL